MMTEKRMITEKNIKDEKPDITGEQVLSVAELEELCRLYLDCKLSVLEEKELEYLLLHTSLTSPAIEDVRALMGVQTLTATTAMTAMTTEAAKTEKAVKSRRKRSAIWRFTTGIAASVTVLFALALCFMAPLKSDRHGTGRDVYITAYCHGEKLSGDEAVKSTDIAMAKADSLMNYAALMERDNLHRAENIISQTSL